MVSHCQSLGCCLRSTTKTMKIFNLTRSTVDARLSAGIISILFNTTIILPQVISPMTRHSAVWVWTPFVMSTTRIIKSMIWAPTNDTRIATNWWDWAKCYTTQITIQNVFLLTDKHASVLVLLKTTNPKMADKSLEFCFYQIWSVWIWCCFKAFYS